MEYAGYILKYQDLSQFKMPSNFRKASAVKVQLWWLVQATLFKWSPQVLYKFRSFLLRLFGAKVGKSVIIRPTVTVTYPWNVSIGDYAWLGDDVVLYSLGEIHIGNHAVVSQRSYLCTGDHDHTQIDFPIRGHKIVIEDEAWVATDVYIAPNVMIGRGAVIGARSSVFKNMPEGYMCLGSPCKPVKPREMK